MVAATTLVPLSEYLATCYRPDRDYLEGELEERNMGELPHSTVQAIFAAIFHENRRAWQTRVATEQRVQVRPERFRIPDVCVLRRSDPQDPITKTPPLLCIEILSSGDTLTSIQSRINDYAAMGVENIWVVDPWNRVGYNASTRGFQQPEDGVLRIPSTSIEIVLAEVFAELDEA